ncbi:hypothetical protein G3T36_08045 [Diaminobutyricibacter tongyongensis]|uniref:Uncharacterized protein n=1 Tax=Leifsonia tongyongensis TaxID=1268043 RepID=A0A6L9XWL1_9MICO|nr:hypothetical protein [Diaminobutyricibacter tongyongensis]NEN05822.1 hypothetical protein [Diaminobutyricibacter tongyongensis]
MRAYTALLSYDNPEVEDIVVTRVAPEDVLPHVLAVTCATAADAVDVFELIDGEPLAPFALYEFRHTRGAALGH